MVDGQIAQVATFRQVKGSNAGGRLEILANQYIVIEGEAGPVHVKGSNREDYGNGDRLDGPGFLVAAENLGPKKMGLVNFQY